jgi:murein DD-endopeptidase MepM/ murein hydrolase activator NlpD
MAYMGNTGSGSNGVHLHLTGSRTVKGVFGVTSSKFDMVEWVATQEVPKTIKPPRKPVVKYCTCCKRPL